LDSVKFTPTNPQKSNHRRVGGKGDYKNMAKSKKQEKILPAIKLKYYRKEESGESPKHPDAVCCVCGKKNIAIGSAMDAYSDSPRFVCESCTIDRYQEEHGFTSRKAAASHRRRMFDVNYLFNELLTDRYIKEKNYNTIDDLTEKDMNIIMETGRNSYNELFSKKEKVKIEETESQKEIERKLKKKIGLIKFNL